MRARHGLLHIKAMRRKLSVGRLSKARSERRYLAGIKLPPGSLVSRVKIEEGIDAA